MSKPKAITKLLLLLTAVACIVGCDHVTKQVATETLAEAPTQSFFFDVVRLSFVENTGSFLSLGADLPEFVRFVLFTLCAGILLVVLIAYAVHARWSDTRLYGLAIFVAGGASNWADRFVDGRVVDFLNLGVGQIRTGIFNVADVAILTGVTILMIGEYSRGRRERHEPSDSGEHATG